MRGVIIIIIIAIMLIGLLERILFIKKMNSRLEYTLEYRDKFVEFCNKTMATGKFSDSHYSFLAKDVNKIQRELGLVASVITVIMGWEWLINFCRAFIEK